MKKCLLWAILPVFLFVFTPLSIWAQFDGSLTRSLYFASDKTDLTAESQKTLSELADSLAQFSSYALHIEGNTDAVGSDDYNKKLSSARVESARFFLVKRGVPNDAFNKKDALGESKPIADNVTDDGKQRNRRVDISVRYRRLPVQESIDKLLSQLENKDQIFSFRAGEDTMFVAEKGTVFQIPANAFDVPDGTLVNFRVRESLTMSDFLRDNLTTSTKNDLLISGGMLHLSADVKGQAVSLKKDAALTVRIPTKKELPNMSYFTGARNPHDNKMAWTGAANIEGLPNGRSRPPTDNSAQLEALLNTLMREEKCECPLAEKYTYFVDSVKVLPSKDLQQLHDLTRATPSVSKPKIGFFERVRRFFGGSVYEEPALATKRSKPIKTEDRYRVTKNAPTYCQDMARFAASHKLTNETWQYIHFHFRKELYLSDKLHFAEKGSWIERQPVRTYAALITRTKMEINALKKIHVKRMAHYERSKSAQQKAYEQAIKNNIVNGVASVNDMNAYVFETRSLGWINCDKFANYPAEQLVAMSLNVPPQPNMDVKLVFKNQKSIISPSVVNGKLAFVNIPRDEEVMIVAFKTENGQAYMCMQDVKTTAVPQDLAFQATTLALLKEKLKGLD